MVAHHRCRGRGGRLGEVAQQIFTVGAPICPSVENTTVGSNRSNSELPTPSLAASSSGPVSPCAEAFVHVVVNRAHNRVGQAVRGVGEHVNHLHQCVAGHPKGERLDKYMQGGDVGFRTGVDVLSVQKLAQVGDHCVVQT